MPGELQPLASNFKIVDADGFPTQYFVKWAQQRQIDISGGITAAEAQTLIDDWAAARSVIAGSGLGGGGDLSSDVTLFIDAALGQLNDVDFSTAPTDGQTIIFDAASSTWIPGSGGGGVSEAPNDGHLYARGSDDWQQIPGAVVGATHHKYWRVNNLMSNGWGLAWAEIELADTIGGPDQCVGGVASTNVPTGYPASQAFDGNYNTFWLGASYPGWLKYEFPAPVEVAEMRCFARNDGYSRDTPQDFTLEFSDDNVTWTPYMVIIGQVGWANGEQRNFSTAIPGGGTIGQINLDDLSNVDMTGKADGNVPVWDATANKWKPGAGGGGGGGGGSGGPGNIVSKAMVLFDGAGAMTLIGAVNVASITRTATGQYTVAFTAPVPPNCALRSSGRFGDNPSTDELIVGVSRIAGEGITTTVANLLVQYVANGGQYDPYDGGRDHGWFYFEIVDPAASLAARPWYWAPPAAADFPDSFGAPVATDDSDVGLIIGSSGSVSIVNVVGQAMTPAVDWTCTMHFEGGVQSQNYANIGFTLYNAAHNKFFIWSQDSRSCVHFYRYNAGGYDGYEVLIGMANITPRWLRVRYVTATGMAHTDYSYDGKFWTTDVVVHDVKSDFGGIDPEFLGPCTNIEGGANYPISLTVDHWSVV